jgi:hypothetical protein
MQILMWTCKGCRKFTIQTQTQTQTIQILQIVDIKYHSHSICNPQNSCLSAKHIQNILTLHHSYSTYNLQNNCLSAKHIQNILTQKICCVIQQHTNHTATQQTVPYKLTVAYVTPHKLKTKQH